MQREQDSELTAVERILAPLEREGIDTFLAFVSGGEDNLVAAHSGATAQAWQRRSGPARIDSCAETARPRDLPHDPQGAPTLLLKVRVKAAASGRRRCRLPWPKTEVSNVASNENGDADKQERADFEIVSRYTDEEAVADGTLIPFVSNGWDTGHRITATAYADLTEHYCRKGYADYTKADFYRFFFNELLPLVPYAHRKWEQGGIFKTDYNFRVGDWKHSKILWYVANEVQGITMMRPEDY